MKAIQLILLLTAGLATAQSASPLSLQLAMSLVKSVKVDGKTTEQLSPSPKNVLPGDVISQMLTVRNTSAKTLRNVPVTLPVPKNTVYQVAEKAQSAAKTEYSIDGGKTFATAPLKRKVTVTENGKSVVKEVEISPNEYNAVRWTVAELAPNQSMTFGYRIQVR